MEKLQIETHIEAYPYEDSKLNVYNRNTGKTYVLGKKETQVFLLLNGTNSIDDIQHKCHFYSNEDIKNLIDAFAEIGFFEKQKNRINLWKIKLRLFNPNKIIKEKSAVTKILHYIITIGCPLIFIIGQLMMRANSANSITYLNSILEEFNSLNIIDGVIIALLSLLCLSAHEFAHMLTARRYGVNVPEMGVMLYFLMPCAYTNITGINLLKSKRKKLVVLLSGSLINIGIIGLCYISIVLFGLPKIWMYCAALMIVNLGTVFINTIIWIKFDGYYVLEIIIDDFNFREKSIACITNYIKSIFD